MLFLSLLTEKQMKYVKTEALTFQSNYMLLAKTSILSP